MDRKREGHAGPRRRYLFDRARKYDDQSRSAEKAGAHSGQVQQDQNDGGAREVARRRKDGPWRADGRAAAEREWQSAFSDVDGSDLQRSVEEELSHGFVVLPGAHFAMGARFIFGRPT